MSRFFHLSLLLILLFISGCQHKPSPNDFNTDSQQLTTSQDSADKVSADEKATPSVEQQEQEDAQESSAKHHTISSENISDDSNISEGHSYDRSSDNSDNNNAVNNSASNNSSETLSLAFVGDIMMGTNFPDNSYVTKDRGRSLFNDSKSILSAADLAIGNLEGTCYDGTEGEIRKKVDAKNCYIFRMPGDHAQHLVDAGIDIVNVANNHSYDFGQTGRNKTLANLKSVGLKATGLKGMAEGCIVVRKNVRIGCVSFAASCANVLDLNNPKDVERYIKKFREQCDILVVGFHGGAEGTSYARLTKKKETFLGENRGDVMAFAHRCIDLGADIVVGHGPHVPRAMELYKGHLIAYSLGNFCAPYRINLNGMAGHAPLLVAEISASNGSFIQGKIHSFLLQYGGGPRTDKGQQAFQDIRRLTAEDFPDTHLAFKADGSIYIR